MATSSSTPGKKQAPMRLDELQRIIVWEGELTNQRIRELLSVTNVHASRLMTELGERLGHRAVRASAYAPLRYLHKSKGSEMHRPSPDEYIKLLQTMPGGRGDSAVSVVSDARIDLSVVAPETFSTALQAIHKRQALKIEYRSMSTPEGSERIVYPHALVRAPRRWHVRAWCTKKERFSDFNLGRIRSTQLLDERAGMTQEDDQDWNTLVNLHIAPHHALSREQARMIADEHFPGAAAMRLKVRACFAPYVVQDLRLARRPEVDLPPDYQLMLMNPHDVPAFDMPDVDARLSARGA